MRHMPTARSSWADKFATISSIVPEQPLTWENNFFLTIDIDWASDEVLANTVSMLEEAGVAATFFLTHRTQLLGRLRGNPKFELAIHPNFNNLLGGIQDGKKNSFEVVEELLEIVPEARAVRSHSMTQSSRLLDLFKNFHLTHDCNHFVPACSGITLRPFRHWNGLIRVPYFWEDDVALIYNNDNNISRLCATQGLKVFDFHPIHVALNTTSMARYEDSRHAHNDWHRLQSFACTGKGVRTMLEQLIWGNE